MKISDFLLTGSNNALTSKELQSIAHISGGRVRKLVHDERMQGVPILSNNRDGYFLAGSRKEIMVFVKSMKHRAKEITSAAKAVSKANL